MSEVLHVVVNGESYEFSSKSKAPSLNDLFEFLNLDSEGRFVEMNGHIYEPVDFNNVVIRDDDVIEIVQFMGGGDSCVTEY